MKVSLVLLTFNRSEAVEATLSINIESAGYPIHEVVHVDNGSYPHELSKLRAIVGSTIRIEHCENLGVSKGYNRGMLLATGTHIVITGCDRIMPKNWLKVWVDHFHKIPNTGVISMYTPPESKISGRLRAEPQTINGKLIQRAIPFEARMHSKEFLRWTGFFREDLGLYSYEDHEWAYRAERIAAEQDLINYHIPGVFADYRHDETGANFKMPDGRTYLEFKKSFLKQKTLDYIEELRAQGFPYYNPYR